MVFSGLVTACRLATCPTSRSPALVMATTDGVVRAPSWLGITTGSPPCITATTELVVPRSIPIILLIAAIPPERRFQLASAALSPAPGRVYRLSVCLSSFLIAIVSYSFLYPYGVPKRLASGSCSPVVLLNATSINVQQGSARQRAHPELMRRLFFGPFQGRIPCSSSAPVERLEDNRSESPPRFAPRTNEPDPRFRAACSGLQEAAATGRRSTSSAAGASP